MSIVTVSTVAALLAAVHGAHSGDVIQLSPGDYARPVVSNVSFAQPVTIASADPAHPARLVDLVVSNASGVTFTDLELTTQGGSDVYYGFRVQTSQAISFDHLSVHGDPSKPPTGQPNGFLVQDSSAIRISASDFHHLAAAVVAVRDDQIEISGNSIHEMDKGGVEGGQISHALIANNVVSDFQTQLGTHADVVQIYTYGTKTPSHDVTIRANLFYRGAGTVPQGIFLQDEDGALPLTTFTVADNVMLGTQWNAIYLTHPAGVTTVTGNIARSSPGANPMDGTPVNYAAWLFLRGDLSAAEITDSGNAAQAFMDATGHVEAVPAGDVKVP